MVNLDWEMAESETALWSIADGSTVMGTAFGYVFVLNLHSKFVDNKTYLILVVYNFVYLLF